MNNAKCKIRYSQRTALTLIELIVAVGLMVMIIAGIGYVFSSTSKTVSASRNASEVNCSIRAMTLQISDDFRMLDKDGFLAIVGATEKTVAGNRVTVTPPILMFTVTGLFEPIRVPDTGSIWTDSQLNANATTNSAVIMYTLAKDSGQLALVRYVYRLSGQCFYITRDDPMFIGDLVRGYIPDMAKSISEAMACGDFMFASLPDIQALELDPSPNRGLINRMLYPFLYAFASSTPGMGWPEIDVDPADIDGVEQLWPYMIGGLPDSPDAMNVDFYDGNDADDTDPYDYLDGESHVDNQGDEFADYWLDITELSVITDLSSSYRNEPSANKCIADAITVNGVDYPVVIWTGKNKDVWPQQLRFRMQLTNISNEANTPRAYELVLPVR